MTDFGLEGGVDPPSRFLVCKRVLQPDTMARWLSDDMSDMPPRFDAQIYSLNLFRRLREGIHLAFRWLLRKAACT